MPMNHVPILFDHRTLTLLHRLLERAQEAGLVQAGEQDAASFLQTLIRDSLLDLDTLRRDEDLDEEADLMDAHQGRHLRAWLGRELGPPLPGEEGVD